MYRCASAIVRGPDGTGTAVGALVEATSVGTGCAADEAAGCDDDGDEGAAGAGSPGRGEQATANATVEHAAASARAAADARSSWRRRIVGKA